MQPDDFDFLARLLKERSGLVLTRDKGYLVENRLASLVRQRKLRGTSEMLGALRAGDAALVDGVIDAMLSKDTGFFRDWKPFEHLRLMTLPRLLEARRAQRTLRLLSAGAATGQEAYSLAMILHQAAEALEGWSVEIVAIDLSASALAHANAALYSQFDAQRGLPIRTLLTHFDKDDDSWRLREDIRARVQFKVWNLLDDLFPLGKFDVVLCRNVLPYFDLQTRFNVLQKISRGLAEDGALYVGLHEALAGVSPAFRPVEAALGVYQASRGEPLRAGPKSREAAAQS